MAIKTQAFKKFSKGTSKIEIKVYDHAAYPKK